MSFQPNLEFALDLSISRPKDDNFRQELGLCQEGDFMARQIAFVSSEVHPYSKSGGLADVAGALPIALAKLGLDIKVFSPWYSSLKAQPELIGTLDFDWLYQPLRIGKISGHGVDFMFLGMHAFDRANYYGYFDDVRRFTAFSRALLPVLEFLQLKPDVIHLNDWQTGLIAPMVTHSHLNTKLVYSIHNLAYQGRWNIPEVLTWSGLPPEVAGQEGLEYYGDASCAKAGLAFSNVITTVSPTYALEIQTPQYGEGLDGFLRSRGVKGILNGIDTDYWNPSSDQYLEHRYKTLEAKSAARAALCQKLGLDATRPILGMVTRLTDQKGLDLVLPALQAIVKDWNLVVLGSGETHYQNALEQLKNQLPSQVAFSNTFDEPFAHQIYAGADAFLMPSRFEPCGLSQLISMRYGTVPIVRYTGGLIDTVPESRGYGFQEYQMGAMLEALTTARRDWQSETWRGKAQAGMNLNFSWDAAALEYQALYTKLLVER
jgi:starch synthase